jgi:translation elongation factor EF-1alpha
VGGIDKRTIEKFEKFSILPRSPWHDILATRGESARGISIDLHGRECETPKYRFTLIDTPGHTDFTKNMIAGISQVCLTFVLY